MSCFLQLKTNKTVLGLVLGNWRMFIRINQKHLREIEQLLHVVEPGVDVIQGGDHLEEADDDQY